MITKEELYEKHKDILAPRTRIACEEGWHNIVDIALTLIAKHPDRKDWPDFKICTIKEKFGGLRIYWESLTCGGHAESFLSYVGGVVATAESLSYATCEVTGNAGVLCKPKNGSWLRTLSPEQQEKLEYVPYVRPKWPPTKPEGGVISGEEAIVSIVEGPASDASTKSAGKDNPGG